MSQIIRLPLSVDHQKKKASSVHLPFALYLGLVSSVEFEEVLPQELHLKCRKLKEAFFAQNTFFSAEYDRDYERSGYVRFLTGPDVHKFLCKLLSLNYQTHKDVLQAPAGSFQEYFADLSLFWNEKYVEEKATEKLNGIREAVFCFSCVKSQYTRAMEKQNLMAKLDDFARQELAERDRKVEELQRQNQQLETRLQKAEAERAALHEKIQDVQEAKLVLVPGDPHHMLGLETGCMNSKVEKQAKKLLKALHPDKSGMAETAYLFDMVIKARDMVLKGR